MRHQTEVSPNAAPEAVLAEFFLVVTPGLETIAGWELGQWRPGLSFAVETGGLSFRAPVREGLELNRILKVPTRILLRVADFGCRDFPKLYKKVRGLPWESWLGGIAACEFSASSHRSRLKVKRRIEETCGEAFAARARGKGGVCHEVLVRFVDDVCTISLDTSGEPLYKRGLKGMVADAPIRETMAASLLLLMERTARDLGLGPPGELVDPMVGTGTFLLEAAGLRRSVVSRGFAFESYGVSGVAAAEERGPPLFSSLRGFDVDEKMIEAGRANFAAAGVVVSLEKQNVFIAPALEVGPVRWSIVNPPYGVRLKVEGRLSEFYEKLFASVDRSIAPELAGFVLPEKSLARNLRLPGGWREVARDRFLNGGLAVAAVVYQRLARV